MTTRREQASAVVFSVLMIVSMVAGSVAFGGLAVADGSDVAPGDNAGTGQLFDTETASEQNATAGSNETTTENESTANGTDDSDTEKETATGTDTNGTDSMDANSTDSTDANDTDSTDTGKSVRENETASESGEHDDNTSADGSEAVNKTADGNTSSTGDSSVDANATDMEGETDGNGSANDSADAPESSNQSLSATTATNENTTTADFESTSTKVDVDATDLDGSGTETDPYEISNVSELQAMEDDLDANYTLVTDIDASNTAQWNNGSGFDPIGPSFNNKFIGVLDGAGHTIDGLTINRSTEDRVGLIGVLDDEGTVRNVSVIDADITGNFYTGGLVGTSDGTVVSSSATGTITSSSNNAGGLAGSNDGLLTESSAQVTVTGDAQIGGLVGLNAGTVSESYATGSVTASGYRVGGLVATNVDNATVSSSYATGPVTGNSKVGGLVGLNLGTTQQTVAVGSISGSSDVGGLVGGNTASFADTPGTVEDSYFDEQTTGQPTSAGNATELTTAQMTGEAARTNMSGLDFNDVWTTTESYPKLRVFLDTSGQDGDDGSGGENNGSAQVDVDPDDLLGDGTKSDPYQISNASELQAIEDDLDANYTLVTDIDASNTAQWNNGSGFDPVGDNPFNESTPPAFNGLLDGNNYTITELTINRPNERGIGLFRSSSGTVADVSLTDLTVTGGSRVGGLVADNYRGTIQNATVSGSVSGSGFPVGGLVGYNSGTVENTRASGSVNGNFEVGGLVGGNGQIGIIRDSKASGSVNANGDVGGLVGNNGGTVSASRASVSVTGGEGAGGLVGKNTERLQNVSASGSVTGSNDVGGLVGFNYRNGGTIKNASAFGSVNGSKGVGGLVGTNTGTVVDAFATGSVTGDTSVGGLTGSISGTTTDGYWDTQTTGQPTSAGGATGLMTSEMQNSAAVSNMSGLDFGTTWQTRPDDYPTLIALQRQTAPPQTPDQPETQEAAFTLPAQATASSTLNTSLGDETRPAVVATNATSNIDGAIVVVYEVYRGADRVAGVRETTATETNGDPVTIPLENTTGLPGQHYAVFLNESTLNSTNPSPGDILSIQAEEEALATQPYDQTGASYQTIYDGEINITDQQFTGSTTEITVNRSSLRPDAPSGYVVVLHDQSQAGSAPVGPPIGASQVLNGTQTTLSITLNQGTTIDTTRDVVAMLHFAANGSPGQAIPNADEDNGFIAGNVAERATITIAQSDDASEVDVDPSNLAGNGTEADPYEISNASELQAMENDLDANYTLVTDIDASNTAQWNNGTGFNPVGEYRNEFTGSFDGRNHTITGLTIDRPDQNDTGLFGVNSGTLREITLANATITGGQWVGGLAGTNFKGTIQDAKTSGSVNGIRPVGGLVGLNINSTVQNVSAASSVNGSNNIGGLVGDNEGTISDATVAGSVNGSDDVGGLAGDSSGIIQNTTASGSVNGNEEVGGLVGVNEGGIVENVSASGNVNGSVEYAGGLVGFNDGPIQNATASGNVNGNQGAGGLVGNNDANVTVTAVTASGSVNGSDQVGGLIGLNEGIIAASTAVGNVSGSRKVGGLVGSNDGKETDSGIITRSTASGEVTGTDIVGGLVGVNSGEVRNATASGNVSGMEYVGGLVGYNNEGTIGDTFATARVTGSDDVGGLVGLNTSKETIRDSYWDEQVTGQATSDGNAVGLTTAEMTGEAARTNMSGLDFETAWRVTDGYPELRVSERDDSDGGDISELAPFPETTQPDETTPPNLAGKFRVEQSVAGDTTIELLQNSSTEYSINITAPDGSENVTFYLQTKAISASQDIEGLTMYLDGEEQPFVVNESAGPGQSSWVVFNVPHFSTRTVSFTTTSNWSRTYETDQAASLRFGELIKTGGGGVVLAGVTDANVSDTGSETNVTVLRAGSDGTREWITTVDPGYVDTAEDVIRTSDGGFVTVGIDTFVKLDSNGNVVWLRANNLPGLTYEAIVENNDSALFLAGNTCCSDDRKSRFMGTDASGVEQWNQTLSITNSSYGGISYSGASLGDGAVFSIAGVDSEPTYLYALQADGNKRWEQTIPDLSSPQLQTLPDGDILVTGTNETTGSLRIIRVTPSNYVEWDRTYDAGSPIDVTVLDGNISAITEDKEILRLSESGDRNGVGNYSVPENTTVYSAVQTGPWEFVLGGDQGAAESESQFWLSKITVAPTNTTSAPSITAPGNATYDPSSPLTIGTSHNATGVIDDSDVGIRIVNVTAGNDTQVALNDSVPVEGRANTTIPADRLSGDVTIETQLYNVSSETVVEADVVSFSSTIQSTLTVNNSDPDTYDSIQAAVDNATDGDKIEIRSGTYRETVALDKNVTVTAVDGATLNGSTLGGVGSDPVGYVDESNYTYPIGNRSDFTTGISIADTVYPTVSGLTITDYTIGVNASGTTATWTVRNTTITNTSAVGINALESEGNWLVENSSVSKTGDGNSSTNNPGIDVRGSSGDWRLHNSTVENIDGGRSSAGANTDGIEAFGSAGNWTIRNTTVRNIAQLGIDGSYTSGDWTVQESHVAVVQAAGIGAGNPRGNATVRDTTIRNVSGQLGGIYIRNASQPWLIDNAVIENASAGFVATESRTNWTVQDSYISETEYGVRGSQSAGAWIITNTTIINNSEGVVAENSSGAWTISESRILNNKRNGVTIGNSTSGNGLILHENTITSNQNAGLLHNGTEQVNATRNWWGAADGPSGDFTGSGEKVFGNVTVQPFYTDANLTMLSSEQDDGSSGDDGDSTDGGDGTDGGGSTDAPTFTISGWSPQTPTVTTGETLTVTATIENGGGAGGTQTAEYRINGTTYASKTVTLSTGENTTVEFTEIEIDNRVADDYDHGVFTENDSQTGTLTVEADTGGGTGGGDDGGTDDSTPGFGSVASLLALVAFVLITRRERD